MLLEIMIFIGNCDLITKKKNQEDLRTSKHHPDHKIFILARLDSFPNPIIEIKMFSSLLLYLISWCS